MIYCATIMKTRRRFVFLHFQDFLFEVFCQKFHFHTRIHCNCDEISINTNYIYWQIFNGDVSRKWRKLFSPQDNSWINNITIKLINNTTNHATIHTSNPQHHLQAIYLLILKLLSFSAWVLRHLFHLFYLG